ncbi:hypothetical protein EVAR_29168_1 [Eumeta japonica]|uniref:Histone-lysine N-methyltransferase SETMAR n=1 Tax=Eumeta variegata TaxID=151549 RepID=A0A4C1VAB9_EUMVA|nr:hypothetical protein EVAR_29168_1 [Eumeta japonica]
MRKGGSSSTCARDRNLEQDRNQDREQTITIEVAVSEKNRLERKLVIVRSTTLVLSNSRVRMPKPAHAEARSDNIAAALKLYSESYPDSQQPWFTEFKRSRVNLSDELYDGRPSTAVNNKNNDAVCRMMETDRHVTIHEIRSFLGISMSQIQSILHKHLGMKKLSTWWIPLNLNGAQKTDRVTWYNAMLTRFKDEASNLAWDKVTGYETWIYC